MGGRGFATERMACVTAPMMLGVPDEGGGLPWEEGSLLPFDATMLSCARTCMGPKGGSITHWWACHMRCYVWLSTEQQDIAHAAVDLCDCSYQEAPPGHQEQGQPSPPSGSRRIGRVGAQQVRDG